MIAVLGMTMSLAVGAEKSGSVEAKVKAVCQSCHGLTGDSISPTYPRINGQQADYLAAQLKAFRGRGRDDTHARGYMWAVARDLDDKMIGELAQYYAAMKSTSPQMGGSLAAEGEKLYLNGAMARGIVPCQQCHGKAGEGMGAFPRVAGQHAAYFRMVMGAFRSGLRKNDIMVPIAKNLTDREIEALSSYLSND
jgi:cytochrome c553